MFFIKVELELMCECSRLVGRAEAIATGTIAGYNAARKLKGEKPLIITRRTAIGELIAYANYRLLKLEDHKTRITFAGSHFFNRMLEKNLYTTDVKEIENRIEKYGITDVFNIN